MEQIEIKLKAIQLVNEFKPVLTDEEYIVALNNATIATVGTSSTAKDFIFGEELNNTLNDKLKRYALKTNILCDDSTTKLVKLIFIDHYLNSESTQEDWDNFKNQI